MSSPSGSKDGASLVVAGWSVDAAGHRIERGDVIRHLEPRVLQVLMRLLEDAPSVVSRPALLAEVWGSTYVSDDAVSAAIIKLRRAFDDDPRHPSVIETIPKSGYRLVAAVSRGSPVPTGRDVAEGTGVASTTGARFATVMRCRVDASPANGGRLDPEGWRAIVNAAAAVMTPAVERYDGWVSEDALGLLAVFGAPVAQEHHFERALSAAAALVGGRRSPDADNFAYHLHLGIATGPVVVTSSSTGQQTIYGEPAALAATLAAAAEVDEVLVVPAPAPERPSSIAAHLSPRSITGISADVFRLEGVSDRVTLWDARTLHGLTPLQGRAEELDRLEQLLHRASAVRGQVVTIVGEPGVGKSRLLHELVALASRLGVDCHVGQASPVEGHSPYVAWRRLLGSAAPLVRESLRRDDCDKEALQAVLAPDEVDPRWAESDPDARQTRTADEVMNTLLAANRPTLLALEDVHWSDQASRALTESVAHRMAGRPCLLVMTTRPRQDDPFAALSFATTLWVDPLGPRQASAMLDSLVGHDPSLADWKRLVLNSAAGTPLFLEESVRAGRSGGSLSIAKGRYLAGPAPTVSVPPSVQSLIAERLDHLSATEHAIVAGAAVVGPEVGEDLLRTVAGVDDADWRQGLSNVQREELLYLTTEGGRRTLVFKHALTREVAYLSIGAEDLRLLHRRAARALATESPVPSEALAWHLQESDQPVPALEQWLASAESSSRAGSFADALAHLGLARQLLPKVDDKTLAQHLALAVDLATGAALVQTLGPTDLAVEECYDRARALAAVVGTPDELFQATWGSWFVHLMRGDLKREREFGSMVAEISRSLTDPALRLEAHHVQWSGLTLAGNPLEAIDHSDQGIEQYDPTDHHWLTFAYGGHDPGVCARNLNALSRWIVADVATARARAADAVALADALGHPYSQLEACQAGLAMALLDGDVATVRAHSSRLIRLVEAGQLPAVAQGYAEGFLAGALAIEGEPADAAAMMRIAAPVWTEFWGAWCYPLDGVYAQVLAAAGFESEAIEHLEQTLSAAETSGGHWWDAELLRLLATLRLRRDGDDAAAIAGCSRAMAIAGEQGALLLELRAATTYVGLATGNAEQEAARAHLVGLISRLPVQPEFTDLAYARKLLDA